MLKIGKIKKVNLMTWLGSKKYQELENKPTLGFGFSAGLSKTLYNGFVAENKDDNSTD